MPRAPRLRTLVLAPLVLLVSLTAGSGEDRDLTYRATVSEVRLTFFAGDKRNRSVDVAKDDFVVVDDEWVVRDFRSFSRAIAAKVELVVLVDASQSVQPQYRREIAEVLQLLGQTDSIRDDPASVVAFAGLHPSLVCAADCRNSADLKNLLETGAGGATPLFDAVMEAAKLVSEHHDPEVRPVFILFSDGNDTVSMNTGRDAIEAALASEAQIYAVDLNSKPALAGSSFLKLLAELTGGRYFPVTEGAIKVLRALLDDLHSGYQVSYKLPSRNQGFHAVQILPTRNLNLQFRCRRGYFYPRPTLQKES